MDEDRSGVLDLVGLVLVEDVLGRPCLAVGLEADVLRAHLSHPLTFEVSGFLGAILRIGVELLLRALCRLDEFVGRTGRRARRLTGTDVDRDGSRRGSEPPNAEERHQSQNHDDGDDDDSDLQTIARRRFAVDGGRKLRWGRSLRSTSRRAADTIAGNTSRRPLSLLRIRILRRAGRMSIIERRMSGGGEDVGTASFRDRLFPRVPFEILVVGRVVEIGRRTVRAIPVRRGLTSRFT